MSDKWWLAPLLAQSSVLGCFGHLTVSTGTRRQWQMATQSCLSQVANNLEELAGWMLMISRTYLSSMNPTPAVSPMVAVTGYPFTLDQQLLFTKICKVWTSHNLNDNYKKLAMNWDSKFRRPARSEVGHRWRNASWVSQLINVDGNAKNGKTKHWKLKLLHFSLCILRCQSVNVIYLWA